MRDIKEIVGIIEISKLGLSLKDVFEYDFKLHSTGDIHYIGYTDVMAYIDMNLCAMTVEHIKAASHE